MSAVESSERDVQALPSASQDERTRSFAVTALAFASIMALALFLRVWRIVPDGTLPDTYEQMRAAKRLLSGDLPVSDMYPPGIAIVLAPFFAVLPDTVSTVQIAVVTFSLALVALAYVVARRADSDTGTALLFTAAICIAPGFVQMGRVGLFDAIGTTLLVLCIVVAPMVRRATSWPASLALAALLAVTITVRLTNVFVLPAVLIAYAEPSGQGSVTEEVRRSLLSRRAALVGALTIAFTVVLVLPGMLARSSSPATLTLDGFGTHVLLYYLNVFGGLAAPVVIALAVAGWRPLWRRSPALALVTAYLVVVWPLAHAPFPFAEERYMLPAMFFALLAAAHGVEALWRRARSRPRRLVNLRLATAFMLPAGVVLAWGLFLADRLGQWPEEYGLSDESAMRELRPVVAAFEPDSLTVTALARGFDVEDRHDERYLDLIDIRRELGDGTASIQRVVDDVDAALADGRPVYYLYSRFEHEEDDLGLSGRGLEIYFAAVEERFRVRETYRAEQEEYRVYRVTMR